MKSEFGEDSKTCALWNSIRYVYGCYRKKFMVNNLIIAVGIMLCFFSEAKAQDKISSSSGFNVGGNGFRPGSGDIWGAKKSVTTSGFGVHKGLEEVGQRNTKSEQHAVAPESTHKTVDTNINKSIISGSEVGVRSSQADFPIASTKVDTNNNASQPGHSARGNSHVNIGRSATTGPKFTSKRRKSITSKRGFDRTHHNRHNLENSYTR
jgi:hypothetical protein